MKAVVLVSHGSRSRETLKEIQELIKILQSRSSIPIFEYAFLEIEQPNIPDGIKKCIDRGASEITVLLNFLNSGKHVNQDIPQIVSESQKQNPQVKIKISEPVGQHSKVADLFLDMIK